MFWCWRVETGRSLETAGQRGGHAACLGWLLWVRAGAESPQGNTDLVVSAVFCKTGLSFPSSLYPGQAYSVPAGDIR